LFCEDLVLLEEEGGGHGEELEEDRRIILFVGGELEKGMGGGRGRGRGRGRRRRAQQTLTLLPSLLTPLTHPKRTTPAVPPAGKGGGERRPEGRRSGRGGWIPG
jgi:hypothetical protein